MHIDRIEIHRVGMPLVYPFRTAFGNDDRIESVLVAMHSGDLVGWGEASPWQHPHYSAESARTSYLFAREFLAPHLVGREISSGDQLQQILSPVKGNWFAKAALDLAWWDLEAKLQKQPLYRLLGGRRNEVEVGADFGIMESVDLLIRTIAEAVEQGFPRVKLKYRPGWELEMIRAVRREFPRLPIHVDCNSAYTLADASMLLQLDEFDLAMIEQPLMSDDLIDHAELQKQMRTPICLDESITSADKARKAARIGACGWVNIKPGRVGGLTNALQIHDECARAGIPCWVGGMLESSVGGHHCLALATLPNMRYPSDIFPTSRFYAEDVSVPEMTLSGAGRMALGDGPGCGAEPDLARLAARALESAVSRG